jgi:hypothetical protein
MILDDDLSCLRLCVWSLSDSERASGDQELGCGVSCGHFERFRREISM